jgi:hypothetical protein
MRFLACSNPIRKLIGPNRSLHSRFFGSITYTAPNITDRKKSKANNNHSTSINEPVNTANLPVHEHNDDLRSNVVYASSAENLSINIATNEPISNTTQPVLSTKVPVQIQTVPQFPAEPQNPVPILSPADSEANSPSLPVDHSAKVDKILSEQATLLIKARSAAGNRPNPAKPLRNIMIFASEVAPLVGLSAWRPFPEVFETLWARNDPSGYNWCVI